MTIRNTLLALGVSVAMWLLARAWYDKQTKLARARTGEALFVPRGGGYLRL